MYIDCKTFCQIDENITIANKALHVSLIAKKNVTLLKSVLVLELLMYDYYNNLNFNEKVPILYIHKKV